jgi:hypothetical protein
MQMISSKTRMDPFFQDIIETRFPLAHEEGKSKVVPLAEAIRRNVAGICGS